MRGGTRRLEAERVVEENSIRGLGEWRGSLGLTLRAR